MIFTETKLKGAFLVEVKKLEDDRGFFGRAWCQNEFGDHGTRYDIRQINTSYTVLGKEPSGECITRLILTRKPNLFVAQGEGSMM